MGIALGVTITATVVGVGATIAAAALLAGAAPATVVAILVGLLDRFQFSFELV